VSFVVNPGFFSITAMSRDLGDSGEALTHPITRPFVFLVAFVVNHWLSRFSDHGDVAR
jgi:hypothetical protein